MGGAKEEKEEEVEVEGGEHWEPEADECLCRKYFFYTDRQTSTMLPLENVDEVPV